VVVEALAAGMLAIVSDRVGAKEAIQEGRTGWVVPVADAGALAACMGHAITNRQHLEALRGEATKAAAAYTWDMYHRRVVAHIKGITGDTSQ